MCARRQRSIPAAMGIELFVHTGTYTSIRKKAGSDARICQYLNINLVFISFAPKCFVPSHYFHAALNHFGFEFLARPLISFCFPLLFIPDERDALNPNRDHLFKRADRPADSLKINKKTLFGDLRREYFNHPGMYLDRQN